MYIKIFLKVIWVAIMLSACASPYRSSIGADDNPINLIPMYGYPDIQKTEDQKKADDLFIKTVTGSSGSRKNSSKEFSARGWYYLQQGDRATSMRRFNQSWLLEPDYYWPYWGFGVLLKTGGKVDEAVPHFDKALSLIGDDDNDKPRLLLDAANAYATQGRYTRISDSVKSEEFFEKAHSLVSEAVNLAPYFGDAYRVGAQIYYDQGNYKKAWEIVKTTRAKGKPVFDYKFIEKLSGEMPEPK